MDWIAAGWWLLYAGLGLLGIAVLMEGVALWRLLLVCFREVRTKTAEAYEHVAKLLPRDPE